MNNNIPSLESLSFKTILENFSRYVLEWQRTNDDNIKKNMFFLQRKYSKMMLDELDQKKILEEFHLDFLLNEHLQIIDIAMVLFYSNKDKIIEKLIPISHYLVELSCSRIRKGVTEKDSLDILTAIIPHAVNVQKMNFSYMCNDELLKSIACCCPHLTELDIHYSSEVSDEGLTALCVNPENPTQGPCKLTCLDLSGVPVTPDGYMILLKEMPTLKELHCFDFLPYFLQRIYKEDIENNILPVKKYNLTSLNFVNNECDVFLICDPTLLTLCAELCPFVKNLIVRSLGTEDMLDACCLFSELESFTLYNLKYGPKINLNNFLLLKGKKLKKLHVYGCFLSVTNLIESCPKLESLELVNIKFEKINKETSKVLQNLNKLLLGEIDFSVTFVTNSIIALLNSSPNVETLEFSECEFGESTLVGNLSGFAFSNNLKYLLIEISDISFNLVPQSILSCNSLETLTLARCDISEEDFDSLTEIIKAPERKFKIVLVFNDSEEDIMIL